MLLTSPPARAREGSHHDLPETVFVPVLTSPARARGVTVAGMARACVELA